MPRSFQANLGPLADSAGRPRREDAIFPWRERISLIAFPKKLVSVMWPWPINDGNAELDNALGIAMRYLEQAGLCAGRP